MRIAKADLVPTKREPAHRLRLASRSWSRRARRSASKVNGRVHRETAPASRPKRCWSSSARLHPMPGRAVHRRAGRDPDGEHRSDDPVRVGALLDPTRAGRPRGLGPRRRRGAASSPPATGSQQRAWSRWPGIGCRRRATRGSTWRTTPTTRSTPTGPRGHRSPRPAAEAEKRVPRARAGRARVAGRGRRRRRAAGPVEDGRRASSWPPWSAPTRSTPRSGVAAAAGRFAEGDLLAIVEHRANGASIAALVIADETTPPNPAPAPGPPSAPPTDHRPGARPTTATVRRPTTHHRLAPALPEELPRGAQADAAALPARRRPRGPGHRQGATLGPRRSPPRPDRRGDPRPRRRHPPDAPQGRRPARREDVRRPGASTTPPSRPAPRPGWPPWNGSAGPRTSPSPDPSGTGKTHFVEALAHEVIDAGMRVVLVHPGIPDRRDRPRHRRRVRRPAPSPGSPAPS